jgi:hypothetical protein
MLASLSNRNRMGSRASVVVMLTALCLTGCSDPEIDRAGTWKPANIYDQNLRAMLTNPLDVYNGTGTVTSRGDSGSRAATRLLTDHRRPLLDASVSHIGSSSGGGADSGGPSGSSSGASTGSTP